MEIVFLALKRAGQDLLAPRMLGLMLWPMGLALLVWGLAAYWFGPAWLAGLTTFLASTPLQGLAQWAGADWLASYAAWFLLILLWLPAVFVTALLITSLTLMPLIVGFVAARDFPTLQARKGGSLGGSLVTVLGTTSLYLMAWLMCLPLWLFAPFGALVSLLLNAWLNQRLFMYDALAEHADARELTSLRASDGGRRFALGTLLGLVYFVPILNLLAPVYMGLAFTHYALETLSRHRRTGLS
ncbi:MAG TPA: EI24 domain-containing protein [Thiobacillaceae bacterium]|nr:EI24 domain-containing protein [Thiobacillaceae bacterium]HNU64340.1 EI24 domain-containing protein [Thiobacillaceae bacterium]